MNARFRGVWKPGAVTLVSLAPRTPSEGHRRIRSRAGSRPVVATPVLCKKNATGGATPAVPQPPLVFPDALFPAGPASRKALKISPLLQMRTGRRSNGCFSPAENHLFYRVDSAIHINRVRQEIVRRERLRQR
jgi:hypothetical protein